MRLIIYSYLLGIAVLAGCSSVPNQTGTGSDAVTYRRTDKLDKVWVAEGFDFSGYEVMLITAVKADGIKPKDVKEEERLEMIRSTLARDLANSVEHKRIVPAVTIKEADLNTASKALKLENTIVEFTRGSSAARYLVGFGAGMPRLRVHGQVTDAATGKRLLEYDIDETADWFASGYASSATLQSHAGAELADDVTEFMWLITKHQPIKYR